MEKQIKVIICSEDGEWGRGPIQKLAQKGAQAVAYIRQTKAEQRKKRKRTCFVFHERCGNLFCGFGKPGAYVPVCLCRGDRACRL